MKLTGARFEISIDGTPRTHRDRKPLAIEAAGHLKRKHPHSTIVVKDLESGEVDAVEYKPICAEEAMPLSSTTTPKACFARLWKLLSVPKPELWREYRAATQGPERQREALELLASVVWHLELAHSLAPWPYTENGRVLFGTSL